MQIRKSLAELIAQRALLDRAITALEAVLAETSTNPKRRRRSSNSKPKPRSKASRAQVSRSVGKMQRPSASRPSARIIPFHVPRTHRPRKPRPWRGANVISL